DGLGVLVAAHDADAVEVARGAGVDEVLAAAPELRVGDVGEVGVGDHVAARGHAAVPGAVAAGHAELRVVVQVRRRDDVVRVGVEAEVRGGADGLVADVRVGDDGVGARVVGPHALQLARGVGDAGVLGLDGGPAASAHAVEEGLEVGRLAGGVAAAPAPVDDVDLGRRLDGPAVVDEVAHLGRRGDHGCAGRLGDGGHVVLHALHRPG